MIDDKVYKERTSDSRFVPNRTSKQRTLRSLPPQCRACRVYFLKRKPAGGADVAEEQGRRIAVITGASSGIGAAAAKALHAAGFILVLGARRLERVKAVGE